jgi:hypothetical protein
MVIEITVEWSSIWSISPIFDLVMRLRSSPQRGRLREDGSLQIVVPSLPYIIL